MAQYIDVGEHSYLHISMRNMIAQLVNIRESIDKLTDAINHQTDAYEKQFEKVIALDETKGKVK